MKNIKKLLCLFNLHELISTNSEGFFRCNNCNRHFKIDLATNTIRQIKIINGKKIMYKQIYEKFTIPILCLIIFFIILIKIYKIKEQLNSFMQTRTTETIDPHFQQISIWEYLHDCNIQHPDIVYAQVMLETGNLTSRLYNEYNNLFGMKKVNKRPTTQIPCDTSVYGKYANWKHSVHDYIIWQSIYAYNLSREEYFNFLGDVYATDTNYVKKLKQFIE